MSNFDLSELSELWLTAAVKPAVVQRNSDPFNPDTLVQQYARLTGMQYQVGLNASGPNEQHQPHIQCQKGDAS